MKMKCINDKMCSNELTLGKIYDVKELDVDNYETKNDNGILSYYNKERFESK